MEKVTAGRSYTEEQTQKSFSGICIPSIRKRWHHVNPYDGMNVCVCVSYWHAIVVKKMRKQNRVFLLQFNTLFLLIKLICIFVRPLSRLVNGATIPLRYSAVTSRNVSGMFLPHNYTHEFCIYLYAVCWTHKYMTLRLRLRIIQCTLNAVPRNPT